MTDYISLRFSAAIQSIEAEGKRHAVFYLMNTSPNRNNWAVTEKALEEALPTLLGKPVGCIPGYRVDHVHEPMQVGRVVKVEKPDGYATATAEITDDEAWRRIASSEWGPVSVVIRAYKVTCSKCKADITFAPDEHVLSSGATEVVESFTFERVDFVSEPAYPQAGVLSTREEAVRGASHSSVNGQAGASSESSKPAEEKKMDQNDDLRKEIEALRAEKAGLSEKVQALEAMRHEEKVQRALEARVKANLVNDKKAEEERLSKLEEDALDILVEDADQVSARSVKAASAQPKARFTKEADDLAESIEEARQRLFGYRRES